MGYNITIGEAYVRTRDDGCVDIDVVTFNHPNAPTFPSDARTGHSNYRSPSYTAWTSFCESTGLYDTFFNSESGLMREHPGAFVITAFHLTAVNDALDLWKRRYPEAFPRFGGDANANLARLMWLSWWMDWALTYCKIPTIRNT